MKFPLRHRAVLFDLSITVRCSGPGCLATNETSTDCPVEAIADAIDGGWIIYSQRAFCGDNCVTRRIKGKI